MTPRHRLVGAGATAILALLLAGCSLAGTPTADQSTSTPVESATPPSPTPTPIPTIAAATCENIMNTAFIARNTWIPVMTTGSDLSGHNAILADGIHCLWSEDPTVGTDNVLEYGWAPATEEAWSAWTAQFLSSGNGWFLEEGERGTYLTAFTDYWVRDDDGYGSTYLYTGEHVIYAMTKAETEDVVGPPMEVPSVESQP